MHEEVETRPAAATDRPVFARRKQGQVLLPGLKVLPEQVDLKPGTDDARGDQDIDSENVAQRPEPSERPRRRLMQNPRRPSPLRRFGSQTMSISILLTVMPPRAGAGSQVDWDVMDRAWGFSFPSDYKAFVEHYGAGVIENFVSVFEPALERSGQPTGPMAEESSVAEELWEELQGIPGVEAQADRISAWAADGTGDLLCWLRAGDDPDQWPVLVYERGKDAFRLYPCGMTEFLVRVFQAQFPEHPLSGTPLWGAAAPRFLTHAQKRQITGQDPWK
ncbi:SMI1/KNR4 family protein [Streptomyces sp. NPDC096339]|uniref:SMI1/KNR4 family protein n=1 Tax=Streptomyces sp. NPDC096339 TaxID=3366086 RepID=UPI003808E37B